MMKYGWKIVAIMALAALSVNAQEKKSWADALTLKGDVRYRLQSSDEDGRDGQPRIRNRFRARMTADAKISDELVAGLRLVTNAGDPISDNQTMTGSFDDKVARFDRAFFTYTPMDGIRLTAGKMAQPWTSVSDLVFAGDVNPEGLAARGRLSLDGGIELAGTAGYFILEERSATSETTLLAGQVAATLKPDKNTSITAGASLFVFDGVEGQRLFFNPQSGFGNTTRKVGASDAEHLVYAGGYKVIEGFARVEFDVGLPLSIGGQYAVNMDADEENTAFLIECRIGKTSSSKPGSWEVGYQFRELEKDSVLGVLAENTDTGNGTNVRAHIPYVRFVVSPRFDVKLQYAMADKGLSNGVSLNTFKADFAVGF